MSVQELWGSSLGWFGLGFSFAMILTFVGRYILGLIMRIGWMIGRGF
jgi:hypothetical protein